MKRVVFLCFFFALSIMSMRAMSIEVADTVDLLPPLPGPSSISEPLNCPVVCDVNHETGSITISTSVSGPVVVTLTGLLTNTTIQRLFLGSTEILLPNADYYEIRVTLPSGEVFVGYFSFNGS